MDLLGRRDSVLSRYGGHGPGEDFDGLFVSLGAGAEAEAEVGGGTQAIPPRQENPFGRRRPAERAGFLPRDEPGEACHPAFGPDPPEDFPMLAEEPVECPQVRGRDLASAVEDLLAVPHGNLGEELAGEDVGDAEVGSRVPVILAALRVALEDPADADTAQAERLREIPQDGGARVLSRGAQSFCPVNRMVDLVA